VPGAPLLGERGRRGNKLLGVALPVLGRLARLLEVDESEFEPRWQAVLAALEAFPAQAIALGVSRPRRQAAALLLHATIDGRLNDLLALAASGEAEPELRLVLLWAEGGPEDPEGVELMLVCLPLAAALERWFDPQTSQAEILEQRRASLYHSLSASRAPLPLSPEPLPPRRPPPVLHQVPLWTVAVAALGGLSLLFSAFSVTLDMATDRVVGPLARLAAVPAIELASAPVPGALAPVPQGAGSSPAGGAGSASASGEGRAAAPPPPPPPVLAPPPSPALSLPLPGPKPVPEPLAPATQVPLPEPALAARLRSALARPGVEVVEREQRVIVRLTAASLFLPGKSTLHGAGAALLEAIAQRPEVSGGALKVVAYGEAAAPGGGRPLSQARATAVRNRLLHHQPWGGAVTAEVRALAAEAAGPPRAPAERERRRRIELVLGATGAAGGER